MTPSVIASAKALSVRLQGARLFLATAGWLVLQFPGAAAATGQAGRLPLSSPQAPVRPWLAQAQVSAPQTDSQLQELRQRAEALEDKGAYAAAEPLRQQILAITEKTQGPEHPSTATSLNNLAELYRAQGRYGEAEPLHKRALAIREKVLGPEHPDTAASLNNLAELYQAQGRYGEAEPLYERSLAINKKVLGPEHPNTADSISGLAVLYRILGRYGEAEPLYKLSLAIREKVLGPEHPSTALSLNMLAELYRAQGRYGAAEPLFKRSLAIHEKVLGAGHPNTAYGLHNLAELYRNQGRYEEAELLYTSALTIYQKALGPAHPYIATILNKLARLYFSLAVYGEIEPIYKHSLAISEKALGPEHPLTATSLNSLADLYRAQGRYSEAEPLYKRSLAISKKVLGPEHPDTVISLNNLGGLYFSQGRYREAEAAARSALIILDKVLGTEHPVTNESLNNLALLHLQQSNSSAAVPLLEHLNRTQANWLLRELPLQPRELRSGLLGQQPDAPASTFALLDQNPAAAPLALEMRLNRQGLLAEIERRQALLKGSSPETRRLAEQVAGIDRLLASVALPTTQREPLRQQRQQLEAQLYRLLPALKIDPVSNAQVAAALRAAAPKGLLVEFQKYRPYGKNAKGKADWGAERYVALLLRPDGTIRAVPLGEAAPIDALVAQTLEFSERKRLDVEEPLQALSARLLGPLQQELGGVRELFLSPDSELNRLPFAALPMPGQSGRLLSEALKLRLLTSGRDLVQLQQSSPAGGPSALVADPAYGSDTAADAGSRAASRASGPDSPATPWARLPGTAEEAALLAPLLQVPQPLLGSQANAARVLSLRHPRLLHIASHGFFWSEEQASRHAAACRAATGASASGVVSGNSPTSPASPARSGVPTGLSGGVAATSLSQGFESLQRSGIVLAGANEPCRSAEQDGYLTAAEATGMDLQGTELTTLSACQTGLGDVRSGEGVYGLQRALTVAGSRSTLLTLWKVGDAATQEFMTEFYKRLRRGEGRAEALAATQATFRNHPNEDYRHVYYWGAFQLTGDWQPIAGW